jgi:hypothetical protein
MLKKTKCNKMSRTPNTATVVFLFRFNKFLIYENLQSLYPGFSNRRTLRENVNAKKTKCNKILDTKTADFHKLKIHWNGTRRRLQ